MNPCPILPTEPGRPKPSSGTESLGDLPPLLWNQMDPASRQQLVQWIVVLIRRIRIPSPEKEVNDHETLSWPNTYIRSNTYGSEGIALLGYWS